MAVARKRPSPRLVLLGIILMTDLVVAAGAGLFLIDDILERREHVEQLQAQLANLQRSQSEGLAAFASARQLRDQVAPLVQSGQNGLPPRLQLLKAVDAQRLLHEMPPLHYRLAAESAEPLAGSGLEQVNRPVELDQQADSQAELAVFWQDLLDKLPGRTRLDSAEIEKTAQGVRGQMVFRQLSLRPVGTAADVP
ncbi:MAG TPA: hypothetical protein VM661_09365 [Candidatus Sulfotelmatobacter sp.]|jgi:hypothetical protein|nr:hypothetical protein [Candidatus Sulfotelmatobacter sp.]